MTLHFPCLQAAVVACALPVVLWDMGSCSPYSKSSPLDHPRARAWLKWCYEMDFRACFCLLDEKAALEAQIKVGKAASWIRQCPLWGRGTAPPRLSSQSGSKSPDKRGWGGAVPT